MTNEEIYLRLKEVLVESFMIEESAIRPEANLYTDLDFDSIDAIDLAAKIHLVTGKQLKPEQFKNVRTVNDAVEAVAELLRS
ncbi:acyl carrier protein [Cellvibrio polysaccharolyticus]|uniref:Acyl carrier protein n=1 Tax=Cellvibrio polysaccharolyticus TaxID=2082724 RepID=A0A928V048_9GAMM|nr:acyl carrier protein [Cellvibrio polysaccharolyticus]MBE8715867.1 acyl carrier protein [Cellvibrio polysaccharolyticus]